MRRWWAVCVLCLGGCASEMRDAEDAYFGAVTERGRAIAAEPPDSARREAARQAVVGALAKATTAADSAMGDRLTVAAEAYRWPRASVYHAVLQARRVITSRGHNADTREILEYAISRAAARHSSATPENFGLVVERYRKLRLSGMSHTSIIASQL